MNLRGQPHSECRRRWRGIQVFHMKAPRNWADVAYSFAVCHHEIAMDGRGVGVRTAANGTNAGNNSWYACFFMLGTGEEPSQEMLRAAEWYARTYLGTTTWNRHTDHKATTCAGTVNKYISGGKINAPAPKPEEDPLAGISDKNQDLLNDLATELSKDKGFRPTSLIHVLNAYRELAKATGADANEPEEVIKRVVVTEDETHAQLLQGLVRNLAELEPEARATSLAHVLNTHRAIARELGVAGNEPEAIAQAIKELGS
jgi:hypothetical protein